MKSTLRTLAEAPGVEVDEFGNFTLRFGDGYVLSFEPLLWGHMHIALYKDEELVPGLEEKIPVDMLVKDETWLR